jgi:hypothetical protein
MPVDNFSRPSPDLGSDFKTLAADLGQKAGEKLDSGRKATADGIASAAGSLHGHADEGGARAASLAHSAADKLASTADYIREHDLNAMFEDVKTLAKRNPVPTLLAAAAIGFLLAKAFSRD